MEFVRGYLIVGLVVAVLLIVKLRTDPINRRYIDSLAEGDRLKHQALTFAIAVVFWPLVIAVYAIAYGAQFYAKKKKAAS